jgi:hypothetical protein
MTRRSRVVSLFYKGYWALEGFTRLLSRTYTGFWLGVLTREQLHAIGSEKYGGERFYWTDEYNTRGLWDWEKRVVEREFTHCKKLLVAAAGGGREVIGLRRMGFEVDGFESDPGLVSYANELLGRLGMASELQLAPWDHCPDLDGKYDAVVVGWGAYMLIRGKGSRVRFLRELRERVAVGAPILVSFYTRTGKGRGFRAVATIGNMLARAVGRDPVETGDALIPNYCHFFSQEELESELVEGGFEPISFESAEYGHSVGRAV